MFIAANWKMNLDKIQIKKFVESLKYQKFYEEIDVCIFPPTIYISFLQNLIQDLPIHIGGQSIHFENKGAFTGETSAISLVDNGCKFVLIGHSERRNLGIENNDKINKCIKVAINSGLTPIICIGEKLEDRKNGNAFNFIKKQIIQCIPENINKILIAYEPIWSIGTGATPRADEIQEMHIFIKKILSTIGNKSCKILYGGSVNASNARLISGIEEVSGLLIGGASLNVKDFLAIYSSTVKK